MTPSDFRDAIERLFPRQDHAAAAFGVTPRTVGRWSSGESEIPPPVVQLLAAWERYPGLIAAHLRTGD